MRLLLLTALVLLFSGCTFGACREPKRIVGGECCLDGNANDICDHYESDIYQRVECDLPYIEYGGSCCLDSNGNKVCDELEDDAVPYTIAEPTTTTSTSSTSTTSTTTSSTTVTSSTTTTTVYVAPTSTTLPVCWDSDGGENYDDPGVTIGKNRIPPHYNLSVSDYCRTNTSLIEYSCNGEIVLRHEHVCGVGEMCVNGECCIPLGEQCKSSSECCSGNCHRKRFFGLCV
ncbi:MAG: hypothetical protein GF416_04210 [Candidatus Altiarchaeales archaeon]|nr:hypothetical protein [Candidatus Altiarchaeales archaeon]MBD3416324.1 hypothetical protein [Candidatus Altiarchaeales archaeon]